MTEARTEPLDARVARLREALGAQRVDAMLEAARAAGDSYIPGDQHPVFGFIQRALIALKNSGRNCGLIFPKVDPDYNRFIDYFDGEDHIVVIYPGEGPGEMRLDPGWMRESAESHPDCPFYQVTPGAADEIMIAFMTAYAHWRAVALPEGAS